MHDDEFDTLKGKAKEVGGTVEREAGEFLGDEELAARGAKHEVEGKAQNMWGKAKDAVGDFVDDVKDAFDPNSRDAMVDKDYDNGPRSGTTYKN